VTVAQGFRSEGRGAVVDRAIQTYGKSAFGHRALKVFRTQQRPDEIGEERRGNGRPEDKIEHSSNPSAKGDETDQRGEDHQSVNKRNHVAHGERSPVAV
jgi:hypothetical protein